MVVTDAKTGRYVNLVEVKEISCQGIQKQFTTSANDGRKEKAVKSVTVKRMIPRRVAVATIFTFFLLASGDAFAHENHDKGHVRMEKLHHIMPMYAQAQAKIGEALTHGDAATIKNETTRILATIPDLKNAEPHKNIAQIAAFRKIASAFAGDVNKTAVLAKTGDFAGAKDAFQVVRMRCDKCHKKFRD